MPKALENSLLKRAHKLERSGKLAKDHEGAYVYGTMRKTGWKPKAQESIADQAKRVVESLIYGELTEDSAPTASDLTIAGQIITAAAGLSHKFDRQTKEIIRLSNEVIHKGRSANRKAAKASEPKKEEPKEDEMTDPEQLDKVGAENAAKPDTRPMSDQISPEILRALSEPTKR